MVRPSTPLPSTKKGEGSRSDGGSRSNTPRTRTPLSARSNGTKVRRFKSFMGASRENLGFAFLNEKRIARRYMSRKMKRGKSMQICDSVNNLFDVTSTPSMSKNDIFASSVKLEEEKEEKPDAVEETESRIEIDYDNLAQERQTKLEELKQEQHLDEKEVAKRKRKRKKMTKRLQEKTKHGQPRMGNQMTHLLQKIQHVTKK